jgi:deoxyuridine 5'-triphosphate nucleotidohydrolase
MKDNIQGLITSKSGVAFHNLVSVLNSPGIIDSDYKDEIKVILFNHSKEIYLITEGQAIAQISFVKVLKAQKISWKKIMVINEGENSKAVSEMRIESMIQDCKRTGGFGSTGQ